MRIFLNEFKKICYKKLTLVLVVALALFIIVITLFDLFENPWVSNNNGVINGLHGIKAEKQGLARGVLDKITIGKVIKEHQELYSKKSNLDEQGELNVNIYGKTLQKYRDLEDLITRANSPIGSFDNRILRNINNNNMKDIYQKRISSIEQFLDLEFGFKTYSQEEKTGFIKLTKVLKGPIKFGYSKGWERLLVQLPLLQLALFLITAVCIGSVFSSDLESGVEQLIAVTKNGRTRLYLAKTLASLTFITLLTITSTFILVITKGLLYGFSGYQNYIQSIAKYWLSPYPYTFFNANILAIILLYLSLIFYGSIVLLISKATRSTYLTVALSILFLIMPPFMKKSCDIPLVYGILNLNPLDIGNFDLSVRLFSSYSIFGYFTTYFQASVAACILCSLLIGLIISFSKQRI